MEALALEVLAQHDAPVGARVLQRQLHKHGVDVGEATVGRLLKDYDEQGLTQKRGRLGRILTSKGYQHLEGIRRRAGRQEHGRRFLRTIDTGSPLILLDVLIGRRAIERETTRLAAMRGTEDELRTLQSLFTQHERRRETGGDAILENRDFHLFIARVAKSRMLEAALELILAETAVSQVLIQMRRNAGSRSGKEHPRIVDAILERNAHAAEAAMMQHIDNIIYDLYRFYGDELPSIDQVVSDPDGAS